MLDLALPAELLTGTWKESDDDYADVVTALDERTRLIRSHDTRPATQWILQHRDAGRWRNDKFFQDKRAMLGLYLNGGTDPQARAILDALPDYCPQRPDNRLPTCMGERVLTL